MFVVLCAAVGLAGGMSVKQISYLLPYGRARSGLRRLAAYAVIASITLIFASIAFLLFGWHFERLTTVTTLVLSLPATWGRC